MRFSPAALLLLGLVAAAPASAESLVVVEARGIALKPGAAVDSTKPLALKPGQHVTLISNSGATLTLDGPYNQAPSLAGGGTAANTFAALVSERGARTAEVGTTRGTAPVAQLPDPWLIDVSHAGNACLVDGQTAVFWRPAAQDAATLAVMPDDRSWKIETQWAAGLDRLAVSGEKLVHGEATYFVDFNGTEAAIRVNAVPADLSSDAMRAAWMADKGCEAQAEALARPAK